MGDPDGWIYLLRYVKCGKRKCRSCAEGGHGPYWYRFKRRDGKVRSEYCGKKQPADARPYDAGPVTITDNKGRVRKVLRRSREERGRKRELPRRPRLSKLHRQRISLGLRLYHERYRERGY